MLRGGCIFSNNDINMRPNEHLLYCHPKGATKSCFMNYSCVVIVLFNTIYISLHFLPILLLWCAK